MDCCHLIWYESHSAIIGGKFLFTLEILFVKAVRKLCSDMGWFAVTWSLNEFLPVIIGGKWLFTWRYLYFKRAGNLCSTWNGLLPLDLKLISSSYYSREISIYIKKSFSYDSWNNMQLHAMIHCLLIWNEYHPGIIGGNIY